MKNMGYLFNSDKNIKLIIWLDALLEYNATPHGVDRSR